MDQLNQVIPEDDLAGRGGDVLAQLEWSLVCLADVKLASALLYVSSGKTEPLQNALASGFEEGTQAVGLEPR
jgi:hypothetical protein